jgi:hypothetical protein
MKHNLLYTIFLILFIQHTTSAQIRTLFQNEILYGKVQKVTSTEILLLRDKPNKSSTPIRDTTYFDEKGNTTERHVRANDLYIFKYNTRCDATGNKIETTCDTGSKKLLLKYDKKSNMVEVWQMSKAGKPYRDSRLKYDNKHNLIEYAEYFDSGKLFMKKGYLYDKKGFAYEEDNYTSNGLLSYTLVYTYSNYDDKGNWTTLQMSENYADGTPGDTRITNRQITYYQ